MAHPKSLAIGELSRRTGLSVSAIRFYEERGLVTSFRTRGNQRRFERAEIRRLSFVIIAQQLGLTLAQIHAELMDLPNRRVPSRADWQAISSRVRKILETKVAQIEATQNLLDSCIGCGCLSLDRCALYNPDDRAAHGGPGPRFLLGDEPADFA